MLQEHTDGRPRVLSGLAAGCAYTKFFKDPLGALLKASAEIGPVSAFSDIFPSRNRERLRVVALGPEFNRQVLGDPETFHTTKLIVPGPKDSAHSRLRLGLTALNDREHSLERRLAAPLFNKASVEAFHERFVTLIEETVARWHVAEPLDMWKEMKGLVLKISSHYLFGQRLADSAFRLGSLLHQWLSSGWTRGVILFPHDLPFTPFQHLLTFADTVERDMMELVHHSLSSESVTSNNFVEWLKHPRPDHRRAPLTGQLATLFLASEETLVNALTWSLFLLAQHPRSMRDLQDELDGTLQRRPPTKYHLDALPLLDAVIKESMRLLPPVPYTIRKATQEVDVGGICLKDRQKVYLSHYFTHHLEDLYIDPEAFRPERWFSIKPGAYDYMPFSAGPRLCIGYTYSLTFMKIVLSMILQRFSPMVVPNSRIDRVVQVTMKPRYGMPMILQPRDRAGQAVHVQGNIHEMVQLSEKT